jgi:xanthine dehydrogenase FAD-binding subunit
MKPSMPIEAHRGRYRLIAGATDMFPWAREGRAGDVSIPALIDVSRIPELNERSVGERRVRLGAADRSRNISGNEEGFRCHRG